MANREKNDAKNSDFNFIVALCNEINSRWPLVAVGQLCGLHFVDIFRAKKVQLNIWI